MTMASILLKINNAFVFEQERAHKKILCQMHTCNGLQENH